MTGFTDPKIVQAEVLYSNPATYTATVRLEESNSPINLECSLMQSHSGSSDTRHSISLPETGSSVIVMVNSDKNIGLIMGYVPESSEGLPPAREYTHIDGLSGYIPDTNYRGNNPPDVLPGDYSLKSGPSRLHLSDSHAELSSGNSGIELNTTLGHSSLASWADTVSHKNALFTYKVTDSGGSTPPSLELDAFIKNYSAQSSLKHFDTTSDAADLQIRMNNDTPFSLNYKGSGIAINSLGEITLSGNSVRIDAGGKVQTWGESEELSRVYSEDVLLGSDKSMKLQASGGTMTLESNSLKAEGDSGVSISSSRGSLSLIAGGSAGTFALPGLDTTMAIKSVSGGMEITAGSSIPGPGSLTKPGVRIQSEGGGDIHLNSVGSLGGAFTTGSVVVDSALPASTSLAGGFGNYGIVLNSPSVLMGGVPGIGDTPAGIPGPFLAPVPPFADSFVKHFQYMTIMTTALMTSISAGLATSFSPSSPASIAAFSGPMGIALATMSAPPIGRPLTINSIG